MALFDDVVKGCFGPAVGLGVLALAIPVVLPGLRPQWIAFLKQGCTLFLEAEFAADGDVIDRLVSATIDAVAGGMSVGSDHQRKQAGEQAIQRFKRIAARRSDRKAWDDADREARYRRHMARLQHAVSRRRANAAGHHRSAWDHVAVHAHAEGDGTGSMAPAGPTAVQHAQALPRRRS
jgi:hypothetical protein